MSMGLSEEVRGLGRGHRRFSEKVGRGERCDFGVIKVQRNN